MPRFQTKDDHLSALCQLISRFIKLREDYQDEEIGHARWSRELTDIIAQFRILSDLTLSDPEPTDV